MVEEDNVYVQCQEGDVIEFDAKLKKMTTYFDDIQSDKVHLENTPKFALEFVKKLAEAHNYDDSTVTWIYPWKSNNLSAHIDAISYNLCKKMDMTGRSVQEMEDNALEIGPILQALCILGLRKFRKVVNTTLQIPWHCGSSEEEIRVYKDFWGWKEDDPDFQKEMKELVDQHKPIFDKIGEEYLAEVNKLIEEDEKANKQQK